MKEQISQPNDHTNGKLIESSVLTLKADWQGLFPGLPVVDPGPKGNQLHIFLANLGEAKTINLFHRSIGFH